MQVVVNFIYLTHHIMFWCQNQKQDMVIILTAKKKSYWISLVQRTNEIANY